MFPFLELRKLSPTSLDTKTDHSIELAHYKCLEFYNERREGDFGVKVTYQDEGGQGVVYRCQTLDPNSDLTHVAVKIWVRTMNL